MRNKPLSAPKNIIFAITSRCNLRCKHCLANDGSQDEMDIDAARKMIREFALAKVFDVAIFGGEPLLHPGIFEILDEFSRHLIGLSINTNAICITDEFADRLSNYRIGPYVVSLDGSCSQVHDALRGNGAFDKGVAGIRKLVARKKSVLMSATVTRLNYKDLGPMVRLGWELGVRQVRFNHLNYVNNAECFEDELFIGSNEMKEIFADILEIEASYGEFVTGTFLDVAKAVREVDEGDTPVPSGELLVESCGAGVVKCGIRPDGEMIPCEVLWNSPCGNVLKRLLVDVWRNSGELDQFRTELRLTRDELGECMDCKYRNICYQGHRCSPYADAQGELVSKKYYCLLGRR
ncbi:MAG: radical SAM protein [Thermodesulfovibrionales bacterium]|nr:radical SAM protein [Thermodesulfovibrionales bacterium]